jgi:hypothetical protein
MADAECRCLAGWTHYSDFDERPVGVDTLEGRFGDVSIHTCRRCGQRWLHYHYEHEAFSGSGRWWRGPVTQDQAGAVTAASALQVLGSLPFYYTGGSSRDGRIDKLHGQIGPIFP